MLGLGFQTFAKLHHPTTLQLKSMLVQIQLYFKRLINILKVGHTLFKFQTFIGMMTLFWMKLLLVISHSMIYKKLMNWFEKKHLSGLKKFQTWSSKVFPTQKIILSNAKTLKIYCQNFIKVCFWILTPEKPYCFEGFHCEWKHLETLKNLIIFNKIII